jgi:microcystin-dependent protein
MSDWIAGDTITATLLQDRGFIAGDIKLTARITPTAGWLTCDGSAVSRTTYADLFSAIGTAYGVGDGSTTFNLPDFLGRTAIGTGSGSGLTSRARGDKDGHETHQLTIAEMPAHTHGNTIVPGGSSYDIGNNQTMRVENTGSTGGDVAHNNMQPYGVATYIIKT